MGGEATKSIHAHESLKHLLSDCLQKKFAGLWSETNSSPKPSLYPNHLTGGREGGRKEKKRKEGKEKKGR